MHRLSHHCSPAQLLRAGSAIAIALSLLSRGQTSAADQTAPGSPRADQQAGEQLRRFEPAKGKVRLQGSSNIDDWQVECSWVGGFLQVDSAFPAREAFGTAIGIRAEAYIDVLGLRSIEKDGKPFSNKMDEIMYAKLNAPTHPKIIYRLLSMSLKNAAAAKDVPYLFETRGELVVGGITNLITMPVNVLPLDGNRLKISGAASLRMTDYQIEPPAPRIALGLIKTGNELKLAFDWLLVEKNAASVSANK